MQITEKNWNKGEPLYEIGQIIPFIKLQGSLNLFNPI